MGPIIIITITVITKREEEAAGRGCGGQSRVGGRKGGPGYLGWALVELELVRDPWGTALPHLGDPSRVWVYWRNQKGVV